MEENISLFYPFFPLGEMGFVLGGNYMENRIGVIGIVMGDRKQAPKLNEIIGQYADLILGRMGIPKRKGVGVISLIVEGNTDEIGALTGKIGGLPGVRVRSALTKA